MARYNARGVRPAVSSPVKTTTPARTALGGPGFSRDTRSELFLLAASSLHPDRGSYHERGEDRERRLNELVRQLATGSRSDAYWLADMLGWLRSDGNLRSTAVSAAVEMAAARRGIPDLQGGPVASAVDKVCQRADEPGELLACWTSRYGMRIPRSVRRGLARAVVRLYDEYSLAKWDRDSHAFRFGRVLDLVHPDRSLYAKLEPKEVAKLRATFSYAQDLMRNRGTEPPAELAMWQIRRSLLAMPEDLRYDFVTSPQGSQTLRAAGMTWEAVAGWVGRPMDAKIWQAVLPLMGYEARLRNLRNFDDAGVPDDIAEWVGRWLVDRVGGSRMFPFRFLVAHRQLGSLRWGHYLEQALNGSLMNVPALPGRTLVVVDRSPSMFPGFVFSSTPCYEGISNADVAALFGSAVAVRAEHADLVEYGGTSQRVEFRKGDAILRMLERFTMISYTDTLQAVAQHYADHDRVVIVTDEQTRDGRYRSIDEVVPKRVPVYLWNVGGYRVGGLETGPTRHVFGGMSDSAFRLVDLLERGRDARWPWEQVA